jgi:sulfonate transport system permease protein
MAIETVPSGQSGLSTSDATITGPDALELAGRRGRVNPARRLWAATWPKVLAVGIVFAIWEGLVLAGWRPPWALPAPLDVVRQLGDFARTGVFWQGLATTLRRGLTGYAIAAVIGFGLGIATPATGSCGPPSAR